MVTRAVVEIRGTYGSALVRDTERAVGECRDVAKAQGVNLGFIIWVAFLPLTDHCRLMVWHDKHST